MSNEKLKMKTTRHSPMLFFVAILCYSGVCTFSASVENTKSVSKQAEGMSAFITDEVGREHLKIEEPVHSPCSVEDIPSSGDVVVDCRSRNISRIDSRWFPVKTTILMLDSNNINRLENDTFLHLGFLRNLSICCSNVKEIQINALRGLASLEYLNMENNRLPLRREAFPRTMFNHVSNLRHLYIQKNKNIDSYSEHINIDDKKNCSEVTPYFHYTDIFESLPALESLSIDTFPHVCLGQEFSKFHHLKNLQLFGSENGGFVFLTNETFIGLRTVKVTHLSIQYLYQPVHTETGLFHYMEHLESLAISYCNFGNQLVAKLMWPFVNKTMSFIHFDNTQIHHFFQTPDNVFDDGIIRKETTEYLGKICVADFAWTDSMLFGIEPGSVNTPTWRRCLKTLDFSNNNVDIATWMMSVLDFLSLSALESITMASRIPDDTNYKINAEIQMETAQRKESAKINSTDYNSETDRLNKAGAYSADYVNDRFYCTASPVIPHEAAMHRIQKKVFPNVETSLQHDRPVPGWHTWYNEGCLLLWIPRNYRRIKLVNFDHNDIVRDSTTFIFKRTDHLQEVYLTHLPRFISSSARVKGLERVKLLDISYSRFEVSQNFFDDFPGMEILVARSLLPKNYFDLVMPCTNMVRNMSKLRYLDISNNELHFLIPGTFSTNSELTQIILSGNRFSTVPFDLKLTPKLKVLDLSQNAILYLDEDIRSARPIDAHVTKVDVFYLKLEGNVLACVCSQMAFLVWLDTTSAVLDKGENYSCTSQDGWISHTVSHQDLPGFWRMCNGWSWLMTSIVLALLLMVSFLTTYLTTRFRCAIKAFALRLMFSQFRPMRPQDYRTDVMVCYADDDFGFVKHILLRFLDDELKLRTYIHQRDMPGWGHKDDHIHKAIENSWRIMLVITETFLHRYDMADIMMKFACYAVGPANQGRVFALVEESQVDLIPSNIYAVLDDDKIIVIRDLNKPLEDEQKQSIINCLRPVK